ncbi:aldo/keto reductase [Vibrio natriegens]|uniref:aldo/keto reductase n=1 Tax=Vibrio natriegens TaxID=691 RepID=UPI001EFC92FA|nr:aldo/keto reductase [Vibrio natriegens]MCG9699134.1 aldo/keto reductase [Vibrio natriegens]
MQQRKIGQFQCNPVGLGCMNLSHAYGTPPDEKQSIHLLNHALDLGYNHLDTATLYGGGANEKLVAKAVGHRRDEYVLASKCGMFINEEGKKEINGSPEALRKNIENSLQRLNTDVIDLYYLHRWDKTVPIEESVGELSRLVEEGKIREIGLSEVSAATITKAAQVHPIAAVQSEYSLWTRNPEIKVLETCKALGTAFVAFSPLGRGILTGKIDSPTNFTPKDIRRNMPRFDSEHFAHNQHLVTKLAQLIEQESDTELSKASLASIVLRWVLDQHDHIHVIPGTTNIDHLTENVSATSVSLSSDLLEKMGQLINNDNVSGTRYNAAQQVEIDTEEFSASSAVTA